MNESARHRLSLVLLAVALLLIVSAWYYAFLAAPTERTMGTIQRIFYLHLPAAFLSFLAFFVVFVGSVAYLTTRRMGWDWAAASPAEVGVVFCAAVLISGPLWAKPVWGIWWTWDARLTTTLILFLIYVAYLMLRVYVTDSERGARLAAGVGILVCVDVPFVYMANRWWRTQAPEPVIAGGEGSGLDPRMWWGVLWAFAGLLTFASLLVFQLYRMEAMRAGRAHLP